MKKVFLLLTIFFAFSCCQTEETSLENPKELSKTQIKALQKFGIIDLEEVSLSEGKLVLAKNILIECQGNIEGGQSFVVWLDHNGNWHLTIQGETEYMDVQLKDYSSAIRQCENYRQQIVDKSIIPTAKNLKEIYTYFSDIRNYSSVRHEQIGFTICSLDSANPCSTNGDNTISSAGVTVYQSNGQYYVTRSITYGDGSTFYSTLHLCCLETAMNACNNFEVNMICIYN